MKSDRGEVRRRDEAAQHEAIRELQCAVLALDQRRLVARRSWVVCCEQPIDIGSGGASRLRRRARAALTGGEEANKRAEKKAKKDVEVKQEVLDLFKSSG